MKTINYELANKLYNAGVVIESEESYKHWTTATTYDATPAPNVEEVIEFLPDRIRDYDLEFNKNSISYRRIKSEFYIGVGSERVEQVYNTKGLFMISRNTLLEALEATLEYLLDNGYIGKQN